MTKALLKRSLRHFIKLRIENGELRIFLNGKLKMENGKLIKNEKLRIENCIG